MVKIKLIKATQELIDQMKPIMRDADNQETMASHGIKAAVAMQLAFEGSQMCWVLIEDNEPVFAAGVAAGSILGLTGAPWMLSTDRLDREGPKRALARRCKSYIAKMAEPFILLENFVDIRNTVAINWLKWCGFSFDDPTPYGVEGRLFKRFYSRKD